MELRRQISNLSFVIIITNGFIDFNIGANEDNASASKVSLKSKDMEVTEKRRNLVGINLSIMLVTKRQNKK
jgi:hypothetical protein